MMGELSFATYSSDKASFLQRLPSFDKKTQTISFSNSVFTPFRALTHLSDTRILDYGEHTLRGGVTVDVSCDNAGNIHIKQIKKKK